MKSIIAVSAGQDFTKKGDNIIRRKLHYLNFGLLGLVTMLSHYGKFDIKMFQGSDSVESLLKEIEGTGLDIEKDCECILLSIPSYYSISWSARFCKMVKARCGTKIVVGGRWVVDGHVDWVKNKLKYADVIIEGFGEKSLASLFQLPNSDKIVDGSLKCFDNLDYTLLHDFRKYQPCIEISRGCGSGCQFCVDRNNRRLPNKQPEQIFREFDFLDRIYEDYSVYFEAPHFVFENDWKKAYRNGIADRKRIVPWRCTTRVESVPTDDIASLAECGLKILDIGLESASCKQLMAMHKTSDPKRYLEKAEKLLLACKEYDVWVKFNILLYAGETMETVAETSKWLNERKDLIKDISVSSLVYYYNMSTIDDILALGASIPKSADVEENGFAALDLSPEIGQEKAASLSLSLPKIVANQRDFFDIKSLSYFEPGYRYEAFLEDLKQCDPRELPFRIE